MQLVYETTSSCRQYVSEKGWQNATVSSCPNHGDSCGSFHRLGYYRRYTPYGDALIARYYCRASHRTFSLLPVFFAARMPGTLNELECVAAVMESGGSALQAAAETRRHYRVEAAGMRRWANRRLTRVQLCLITVMTLLPAHFINCPVKVLAIRRHLDTDCALVKMRTLSVAHLSAIPAPVGFRPP